MITQIAREWIGTPYRHQQMSKGNGCDCLGLLRGVYEEVTGIKTKNPPPYSPSWGEVENQELMIEAANEYLIQTETVVPECVLVFRMNRNSVAKHCGIVTEDNSLIHANFSRGVVEENLTNYWLRKIAGIFLFPGS